jgi:hypothetical protein
MIASADHPPYYVGDRIEVIVLRDWYVAEDARCKEKDASVNRVEMYQLLANVHNKAPLIYPNLGRVTDMRQVVSLTIHTERVSTSRASKQTL